MRTKSVSTLPACGPTWRPTYLNLLGGEHKARYYNVQGDAFGPVVVETQWKAGKVVTIYDLELGGGWQNECGNLRLSAGYLFSFWYNMVRTNEWINAVRVELRW